MLGIKVMGGTESRAIDKSPPRWRVGRVGIPSYVPELRLTKKDIIERADILHDHKGHFHLSLKLSVGCNYHLDWIGKTQSLDLCGIKRFDM